MRVGMAAADITPELGIWMSGYGGRTVSEAHHDPLEVQALAIEGDNGVLAVVVGSDLLGFDYDQVAEIRGRITARCGVAGDAVLLNASHTHGGPVLINHLVVEAPHIDPEYRERVSEAIVESAERAVAGLDEAEPHHAWGRCTVGINRRAPEPPYGMKPNPRGFYDDTVGVLAFCRPGSRQPVALLFNASCHPTTLGSQPVFTADWPGAARRAIDGYLGQAPASLFLQGSCGNIRPRTFDLDGGGFRQGTVAEFERMGHACAHEVIRLLSDSLRPAGGDLTCRRVPCELPLENLPTAADLARMRTGTDKFQKALGEYAEQKWPDGKLPTTLPYEAQLLTFGDEVSILALPGEVVSELGHAARHSVPRPTLFCGYSNGLPCYVPTARIRRQGGYESGLRANDFFGLAGWLKQESELVILSAVEEACRPEGSGQ